MMAYRASTYRPGTEDEPNLAIGRVIRERSPRRNGAWSPGREASAGQGHGRLGPRENRSRSPERGSPVSGTLRRISESERRDYERELRAKKALEWKKENSRKSGERRHSEVSFNENAELDRDRAQGHISRIGSYADEFIREEWERGAKVTKGNGPRFAVEVLLYVRKRFYDDLARNEYERDPQNGDSATKLLLENMKWVSDTKISPLTDSKDLFLCNDCENNKTFCSLESLLYHYATRHTTALSNGTIVVDWKAEWPEHPPFNPEPEVFLEKSQPPASVPIPPNESSTAPHGFIPHAEVERKKREQEIREQEIRIKEVKEEIQRKEREKSKKDHEHKERQFRAAEAGERMRMEAEKRGHKKSGTENISHNEPLDNQRILVPDVQQNGRLTLEEITQKPQPDRPCTMEKLPGNLEHVPIGLDVEPKAQIPPTRSVRMGNTDSSSSKSRTSQRLHLTDLFTRFMSEVSEQTALQLRRESAKKILEQKTAAHDKAQVMLKEFPSAEESTRASKEKALRDFEQVNQELNKKREASVKLSEEISELVYPEEEPSDSEQDVTSKMKNLDERLVQYHAESAQVKHKQQEMDELCCTFLTQKDKQIIIESIGDGFGSVRKEISGFTAKTSILEAEMTQLRHIQTLSDIKSSLEALSTRIDDLERQRSTEDIAGLKSIMNALSSRINEIQHAGALLAKLEPQKAVDDITDLRSTVGSISSRIDGLEEFKVELVQAVETVETNLALQTAAINDRSEIQSVHSSINILSRSESEFRAGLAKLQNQLNSIGKDLRSVKMIDKAHRPSDTSARETRVISNEVRIAIHDEIRAQQEAVDAVLDGKFRSLDEQAGELRAQIQSVELQTAEIDASIKSFQDEFAARFERTATELGGVKGDTNSAREEINSLRKGDIQALHVACSTLDYRMNNLSTEQIARQILGQLDAYIRGSDRNLATLEVRLQELERRAASGSDISPSRKDIDESLHKIRKELFMVLEERLIKVKNTFIELNAELVNEQMQLRTEMKTNQSSWESIRVDIEVSKTNITEAMGSLKTEVDLLSSKLHGTQGDLSASKIEFTDATQSLRAEIDSIGPTLQNVQDDLGVTKSNCRESSAALKAEIAKASKASSAEKRKFDSPEPLKTNGHRKKKAKRPISDSEDGG